MSFKPTHIIKHFFIALLLLPLQQVFAQGINTTFGQNRVQYGEFEWSYVRSENFDSYFYKGGRELATFAAKYAEENLSALETVLDHRLSGRIEIICYNTLGDFKQSNFGLEEIAQNTGGYTQVVNNKVYIYFNGDHGDFVRQLKDGMSLVLLNELLYGGSFQERVQSATLLNLPQWYLRGLTSYISKPWDADMDNRMKDGLLSKKLMKFNRLNNKDGVFAGHSIWKFLVDKYGMEVIPNMVYITRITRNYENAFIYVTGLKFKDLQKEWLNYYRTLYLKEETGRSLPLAELKIKRKQAQYIQPEMKVSSKGNYLAFTTNKNGKYKVWLFDTKTGKSKKIFKGGIKYNQLEVDHSFPLVTWQQGGDKLGIIYEKRGYVYLKLSDLVTKEKTVIQFQKFEKITGIDFSDNGRTIVLSAIRKGQSDLYTFDIPSRRERQLTNDFYDDINPRFVDYSSKVVFSSNRNTDSLAQPVIPKIYETNNFDIYQYDLESKNGMLKRITRTPNINETQPIDFNRNYMAYLSDYNGIKNRYAARVEEEFDYNEIQIKYFDSTYKTTDTLFYFEESIPQKGKEFDYNGKHIVLDTTVEKIDTIVHTKDIVYTYPLTNFTRNILAHDVSVQAKMVYDLMLVNNKYYIKMTPLSKSVEEDSKAIETYPNMFRLKSGYATTQFESGRKEYRRLPGFAQPVQEVKEETEIRIPLDTTGYFFVSEFTKPDYKKPAYMVLPKFGSSIKNGANKNNIKLTSPRFYDVTFFADQLVTQIDNSIINTYYQPISSAGAQLFNPGLNGMFKLGMVDLFEDYRFVGGLRVSFDLSGLDYFVSFETLKKRLDHKFQFYRQSRAGTSPEGYSARSLSHEVRYIAKYPISQTSSFRLNIFGRQDRDVYRANNQASLEAADRITNWAGFKLEYIFDNSVPKGLNLWNGTKFKVFYEKYVSVENSDVQMNVLGFDLRHYEKIHRQIIWATRVSANTSFGPAKVVYYLGGVENWITPRFNNDISTSGDQNYIFQALACNLRGFEQNIRNGNTFAVINTEIRFPVFQYAFNRPLRSEFLHNFQVVPFFDIGSAWVGDNPYSEDNTFNQKIIDIKPIRAKVINVRDPIVAGFGGGLRTKLLGYFVRFDVAWGIQDAEVSNKPVYYVSLTQDF